MKHIIIAVILTISNVFLGIAKPMKSQAEIYFAGGCFWGTEHFLKQIRGVESTQVGYANSTVANPSYEQVCSGKTNAAETVKVVYDPEEVNLSLLLNLYFQTIDPTSLNRQGNDRGTQYRTGIYYINKADLSTINQAIQALATQYNKPIAVEVEPLTNFYPAEVYHQDYLDPISTKPRNIIRIIWIRIRADIAISIRLYLKWHEKRMLPSPQLIKNRTMPLSVRNYLPNSMQ